MEFNATFIVSIISFILFVLIMNQILYKPILGIIEKRKKYFEDNSKIENDNKEKSQKLNEEYENVIEGASTDSKNIISDGLKSAKEKKAEIIKEAKEKSKKIQEEEREKLHLERENLKGEFDLSVNDIANSISGVIEK